MKRVLIIILVMQQVIYAGIDDGIVFLQLTLMSLKNKNNPRRSMPADLDGETTPITPYQKAYKNYATANETKSEQPETPPQSKKRSWWILACGTCLQ